jgi:hypothetical protein
MSVKDNISVAIRPRMQEAIRAAMGLSKIYFLATQQQRIMTRAIYENCASWNYQNRSKPKQTSSHPVRFEGKYCPEFQLPVYRYGKGI